MHLIISDKDNELSSSFYHRYLSGLTIQFDLEDVNNGVVMCHVPSIDGLKPIPAFFSGDEYNERFIGNRLGDNSNHTQVTALVGERTQIVLTDDIERPGACERNRSSCEVLTALPQDIRSALVGIAEDYIGEKGRLKAAHSVGTVLLVGPSGSGCAAAVQAVASMHSARLVRVSCGQLYASASGSGQGQQQFTAQWGRAAVTKAVLRAAVGAQPCVLLLEDLHFLVPPVAANSSSGGEVGVASTEASEGVAEVRCSLFY